MNAVGKTARRLLAGLGIAALGLTAVAAGASAAPEGSPLDELNLDGNGSITIHKHVEDEDSTAGNPAGAPLEGVTFEVYEVLYNATRVPLATAEDWQAVEALTPGAIPSAGWTLSATPVDTLVTDAAGLDTTISLPVGLYYVIETHPGDNLITAKAAPFLVTIPLPREGGWIYDVNAFPKNVLGEVVVDKTAGTPDQPADVVLGAIVPFTITVTAPQSDLPYISASITDTLGAGLTFDSWGTVALNGAALATPADYTISADNSTITLTSAGLVKLNALTAAGDVDITAVINAEVTELGVLENTAEGELNGETGEDEDTTNWGGLKILKLDSADSDVTLAGAEFELWNSDKTTLLATGETDANGVVTFYVWVGNNDETTEDVYLKETVAPNGYVLPADPWSGPYTLQADETIVAGATIFANIENYKPEGPDLPLTGSNGTMLLTLGGLALVGIGGGAALVSRNRRRNDAA